MGFSAKQVKALQRNPDHRNVRTREANGRELTYLEGWYAISEANRIFGFDGCSRETKESKCVLARENKGTFLAVYIAGCASPCRRTGQALFARAMAPGKAAAHPPAKCMISPSRPPRPMPPREPWPPLASRLVWSFIGAAKRRRSRRHRLRLIPHLALIGVWAFIRMTLRQSRDHLVITAEGKMLSPSTSAANVVGLSEKFLPRRRLPHRWHPRQKRTLFPLALIKALSRSLNQSGCATKPISALSHHNPASSAADNPPTRIIFALRNPERSASK